MRVERVALEHHGDVAVLGSRSLTSRPPIEIEPAVTSSRPAIIRSSVDLPHPDGPTSTSSSPSAMSRSTASTAGPHRRRRSWWRRGWRCQPLVVLLEMAAPAPTRMAAAASPLAQDAPKVTMRAADPGGRSAAGQPMSTTMASGRAARTGVQHCRLGRTALGVAHDDHQGPVHRRGEARRWRRRRPTRSGARRWWWGRRRPAAPRAPRDRPGCDVGGAVELTTCTPDSAGGSSPSMRRARRAASAPIAASDETCRGNGGSGHRSRAEPGGSDLAAASRSRASSAAPRDGREERGRARRRARRCCPAPGSTGQRRRPRRHHVRRDLRRPADRRPCPGHR